MAIWGGVAFILAILCIVIILCRRRALGPAPVRRPLLDFAEGEAEGQRLRDVLGEALAQSKTDREFKVAFKRLAGVANGIDAEQGWAWLGRLLMEYRRASEFDASDRLLAERFQHDLTRRSKSNDVMNS